jgi:8-oxo-dGTP pyrophosphatase MutT (NUDIX family)
MILPPGLIPKDGKSRTYCPKCRQEKLNAERVAGKLGYRCTNCTYRGPRALIIDPAIQWWTDAKGEYWHATGGIFLHNKMRQFLFFERTTSPLGLAVPAGHVDCSETPLQAAQRELGEETGVRLPQQAFRHISTDDIYGDECRRGADVHRWDIFVCRMSSTATISVDPGEGVYPVWLTLHQALKRELTFAMRFIIANHGREITAASAA